MSVQALADHAACVVSGEVVEVTSYWTLIDGRPTIESRLVLAGAESIKGDAVDADGTITLTLPGGTVDGYRLRVAGAPEFAPGQRWVLFVLPEWRVHPVVGVHRGAFELVDGPDGVTRVQQGDHGVAGLDAGGVFTHGDAMSLAEFRAIVQAAVRGSREHELDGPPGQRRTGPYTPAELRRARRAK